MSNTESSEAGPGLSRKKKYLFAVLVWFVCVLLLYAASIGWRTFRLYGRLKSGQQGWSVPVHTSDPELGYRPIPGIESEELFAIGPAIPTRFDERGFRVPVESGVSAPRRPFVMALGCSFTYGAACAAEETFPQLVADELGGECMNAGVCGYGLAQMLIRARRTIPKYDPDVVLVQYSPWLAERAMSHYAPTQLGRQPVPYFTRSDRGAQETASPVFARSAIDVGEYRETPKSFGEFASFLFTVGVPLLLHDDTLGTLTWIQQKLGIVPQATDQRQQVVDAAYGELDELCQQVGARLVIVILDEKIPVEHRDQLEAASHALVVDAHEVLVSKMPPLGPEVFQKLYCHWRGDPPVLIDHHPNPKAHKIIAEGIVEALLEDEGMRR